MSKLVNQQWLLASRPTGEPSADNFKLVESAVPELMPWQRTRCWYATTT